MFIWRTLIVFCSWQDSNRWPPGVMSPVLFTPRSSSVHTHAHRVFSSVHWFCTGSALDPLGLCYYQIKVHSCLFDSLMLIIYFVFHCSIIHFIYGTLRSLAWAFPTSGGEVFFSNDRCYAYDDRCYAYNDRCQGKSRLLYHSASRRHRGQLFLIMDASKDIIPLIPWSLTK